MNKEILLKTGLTQVQAEIYNFLIENGNHKASDIGKKIKRPRGVAYKGLEELIELELVEKIETKKITQFRAEHPSKLEKLMAEREKTVHQDKKNLLSALPSLISSFNLLNNKPGVRYFEGKQGVMGVLNHIADNFKPNTEIISFVKVLSVDFEQELNSAFTNFIKKRHEMLVKTRVLAINTVEGKKLQKNDAQSLRETRLVDIKNLPLDFPGGEIFIYENEICAVMMEKNTFFAFTVQNISITQLLKAFFESEWELTERNTTPANSSLREELEKSFSKTA
jgi:sugar-specific transcriptional regulator TrmB